MPDILHYPDPTLRTECLPVAEPSKVKDLVQSLTETMYRFDAAGIAAIQAGFKERIFIIDGRVASGSWSADPAIFINPEILEFSDEQSMTEEGCLSFPEIRARVRRPKRVRVKSQSLDGQWFELEANGFYARAIQHEFDHINGHLMIDRLDKMKRDAIIRKMKRR